MSSKRVPWRGFGGALTPTGRLPDSPEMQTITPRAQSAVILPSTDFAPIESRAALVLPASLRERYNQPKKPLFQPSPQQAAYFDWLENGKGNLIMEAVAGAGKSTTLIQGLRFMEGSVIVQAYNKLAADDLRGKAVELGLARKGVKISTSHALGYSYCMEKWPTTQLTELKTRKAIDRFVDAFPAHKAAKDYSVFICKMVSFGKQFLIGCRNKPTIDSFAVWKKLMDHFSVDLDLPESVEPEMVLEWVQVIFRDCFLECDKRIDFDDMIYAPLAHDLRFFPNDWVLVDECQDINPARRELAKRILKRTGRAVFVGDSRQAIYGFTGAGGDSIQKIDEEFGCQKLPLTVSYRCPRAVVNYVHQWVTHIEAHPEAPEGVVRPVIYEPERECPVCKSTGMREESDGRSATCDYCAGKKRIAAKPWFVQDQPNLEDFVLCRFTRPLIQTAYGMIKEGIACRVQGRDIGKGLINLATMWKITSLEKLDERLRGYYQREYEKAQASQSEKKLQELEDKVGTLRVFMDRCTSQGKRLITDLVAEIEVLFSDDIKDAITLCTGHKSKGREAPRVYWIKTGASSRIKKEWEAVEETNINYVIGTRAKSELILVPENIAKGQK